MTPPDRSSDIVIVGAGPAGLSVAACLKRRGLRARLLERGELPGWSWARHYESLRLHTSRPLSALPGLRLRSATSYADRAEVLAYLAAYAKAFDLDVEFGREVTALAREGPEGDAWRIDTPRGPCHARHVILATGVFARPREPDWPGRDLFRGRWLRPQEAGASCAGRRVLVAGLGNTAADLLTDLHGRGARVALSIRGAVHVLPRELLGLNVFRWQQWFPERAVAVGRRIGSSGGILGLAAARVWSRLQEHRFGDLRSRGIALKSPEQIHHDQSAGLPPVISGPWVDLVRRGEVPVFPGIARMTADGSVFADGRHQPFDDVVLAIGYTESRFPLAGDLPVPLRDGPVEGQPGLWICGAAPVLRRIRQAAERVAVGIAEG